MNKRNVMISALAAWFLSTLLAGCAADTEDAAMNDAAENLLPARIAAIYSGWFTPHAEGPDQTARWVENVLDPMEEAGFNAWYHKVQPSRGEQIDLSDPAQFDQVRQLAEACAERGLALVAYTYHYPHGHRNVERWPQVRDYPPLVRADGEVVEDRFPLANWSTWRLITGAVFELAQASRTLPIAAVGFDDECLSLTVSYDDEAWRDFAAEHNLDADLPPEQRGPLTAAQGLGQTYEDWYHQRWDAIIKRWVAEIHAINPRLSIAYMPYWEYRPQSIPFLKYAGTEAAPAIIDCWHLYNGSGLTDEVLQLRKHVKEFNPHNLYVQWFRPDSYRPSDIRIQAYHTLWQLDGYSNWHSGQITGADNPDEYWQAYGQANHAAWNDMAAGATTPSIAFTPVTPLVAQMPALDEPVPQLLPHGDGSGDDHWIPMRELRQVLIYARAGEMLSGEVRHLAGAARPLALQYKLTRPDGGWLYDNTVMPGQTEEFAVAAPATGTYALYVTGGSGGQAWYAVRIHNPWHAVPFEFAAPYLFYSEQMFPLTLWLQRHDATAPASINIRGSGIKARVGDGETQAGKDFTLAIPPGDTPLPLIISNPEDGEIGGSWYAQDIHLRVEGAVQPYLAVGPERMLLPQE